MWLNNFDKFKYVSVAIFAYLQNSTGYCTIDMSANPIRGTNGTYRDYVNTYGYYFRENPLLRPVNAIVSQTANSWTNYDLWCNWVVGSGTTPVSLEDYCLESEITTLSCSAVNVSYDPVNGTVTYDKIMKNTSSEAITVSEIGIVSPMRYYTAANSTNTGTVFPVLVYREVLDTPITAAAGETFTVSITHKFPMPN